MNNHTPGPWEAVDNPDDKLKEIGMAAVIVNKTGNIVCYVFHDENGKPDMTETMANADLIEAAPDLLEACKRALHLVEENNEEIVMMAGSFGLLLDLKEAINKARGRPMNEVRMMDDEEVNLEYSIWLMKNNVKCPSVDLSKSDALIFIHAAEHLIEYLRSTLEERE